MLEVVIDGAGKTLCTVLCICGCLPLRPRPNVFPLSFPNRPAIVVLLMSMVNERQPFVLRCAVLYCFQCFLYKNQKGQGEIVSTLLPSTIDGRQGWRRRFVQQLSSSV